MDLRGALRTSRDILVLEDGTLEATTLTANAPSGVPATVTLPSATSTLAGLSLAQTWSGVQTFDQTALKIKGGDSNSLVLTPNETLTADRTLNLIVNDAARTIDLAGNLTLAESLTTSGGHAVTLTTSGTTSITLPTTGTLATTSDLSSGYQPLDADLTAIAALASTGIPARTASNTWAQRTITAGNARVTVTNGDGVSGNPTLDVSESDLNLANIGGSLGLTSQVTGALPATNGGTGLSALGTGVATWLGTPSADHLRTAVTGTTGTGSLVFATSPTLVTPALGTPASGVLTSCTGLPLTTGVTGTLPIANGGTNATDAGTARTNLGLAIGSDVQAYDADLAALAGLASTGIAVRSAANTWVQRTIEAGNARVSVTNGNGVSGNPSIDVSESDLVLSNMGGALNLATQVSGLLPVLSGGTGANEVSVARTNLGLAIGSNVQAHNSKLDTFAALADGSSGDVFTTNGAGVYSWAAALTSTLTNDNIRVGNASNVATAVDTSAVGDILADHTNGLTIKSGVIVGGDLASDIAITTSGNASFTGNCAIGVAVEAGIPLLIKNDAANGFPLKIQASDSVEIFRVFEDASGNGRVQIANTSGITKIDLDSAGVCNFTDRDLTTTGTIGVGTAPTTNKIEIASSANESVVALSKTTDAVGTSAWAAFRVQSTSVDSLFLAHGAGRTLSRYGVTLGGHAEILINSGDGLVIGTGETSSPIIFGTNDLNRLQINGNGNVGIGTATPDGTLHVHAGSAGSVTANANANDLVIETPGHGGLSILTPNSSTGYIMFGKASDNEAAIIRYNGATNLMEVRTEITGGELSLGGGNGGSHVRIDGSGKVGIGVTGPLQPLHVNGNAYISSTLYIGANADANGFKTTSTGGASTAIFIGNAAINVTSDQRLKTNIRPSEFKALNALSNVEIKDFEWDDPSDTSYNNRNARGTWVGPLAQQLIEHIPFMVNAPRKEDSLEVDHDSKDLWTLDSGAAIGVFIKAIQELNERIEAQDKILASLAGEAR